MKLSFANAQSNESYKYAESGFVLLMKRLVKYRTSLWKTILVYLVSYNDKSNATSDLSNNFKKSNNNKNSILEKP